MVQSIILQNLSVLLRIAIVSVFIDVFFYHQRASTYSSFTLTRECSRYREICRGYLCFESDLLLSPDLASLYR